MTILIVKTQVLLDEEEASNPATSPERLVELAEAHLKSVLQNPSLPLLLVERPDFWGELPESALEALVERQPPLPAFIEWALRACENEWALRTLSANGELPAATRRAFLFRISGETNFRDLVETPYEYLPADEMALLAEPWLLEDDDGVIPTLEPFSEADVAKLATLGNIGMSLALQQPACPVALLESTYRQSDYLVLDHPRLPAWCIADAVASPDADTRSLVGGNPSLTPEQQLQLASDADPDVREGLCNNPSLTPEAQRRLDEMDAKP